MSSGIDHGGLVSRSRSPGVNTLRDAKPSEAPYREKYQGASDHQSECSGEYEGFPIHEMIPSNRVREVAALVFAGAVVIVPMLLVSIGVVVWFGFFAE